MRNARLARPGSNAVLSRLVSWVCAILLAIPAVPVPARAADPKKTLALVRIAQARSGTDDTLRIEELLQVELEATGRVTLVGPSVLSGREGARRLPTCSDDPSCLQLFRSLPVSDLIGRVEIARFAGNTLISVTVVSTSAGTVVVKAQNTVPPGGGLVKGAERVAALVSAALGGPPVEAATAAPADTVQPPKDLRYGEVPLEVRRLGFLAGVELGVGFWNADPTRLQQGSTTGFDLTHYAPVFTAEINNNATMALNGHIGWTFMNYGAIEAAIQSSAWSGLGVPGGVVLAGVRATAYPLQAFLPERRFDIGVELGGGYAFISSSAYDMDGSYFTAGLTFEYYLTREVSLEAFYRLFTPFLTRFYVDYTTRRSEPIQNFTAYWNTLGVGVSFHVNTGL
jgi:hypothetical protein